MLELQRQLRVPNLDRKCRNHSRPMGEVLGQQLERSHGYQLWPRVGVWVVIRRLVLRSRTLLGVLAGALACCACSSTVQHDQPSAAGGGAGASPEGGSTAGAAGGSTAGAAGGIASPFAHCGSRAPSSNCSVVDTCSQSPIGCGEIGSPLDAQGCLVVNCNADGQCGPGERCLAASLQTGCVMSNVQCGDWYSDQCLCTATADCFARVSCIPETTAPRALDCVFGFDASDCGELGSQASQLTMTLANHPNLSPDILASVQSCLEGLTAAGAAQGCLWAQPPGP